MRTEQGEETLPLLQHSHAWGLEHISDSPAVTAGPHTRAHRAGPGRASLPS